MYIRKNHTVADFPTELRSKLYLLKHFDRYIMERLHDEHEYLWEDMGRIKGLDFVHKFLRMKHVIVFKLSHDVLQFNFYDHSKIVLSAHGRRVTYIDRYYTLSSHTLAEVVAAGLAQPHPDAQRANYVRRLVDKLKYCKEVLVSIRAAASQQAAEGDPEAPSGLPSAPSLTSHSSKGSLR